MARKKSYLVNVPDPSKKNFVGTISLRELAAKIRKSYAPTTRTHRDKTAYTRKQKHSGKDVE